MLVYKIEDSPEEINRTPHLHFFIDHLELECGCEVRNKIYVYTDKEKNSYLYYLDDMMGLRGVKLVAPSLVHKYRGKDDEKHLKDFRLTINDNYTVMLSDLLTYEHQ